MPSSEQEPRNERQQPRENEPGFYFEAARFAGERPAGRAYGRLQAAVFARSDCDLSVYRLQLNRLYHVAALGQTPPQDLERKIRRILSAGERTTLPSEVMATLITRRIEQARRGPWTEGHHRPGKRL